MATPDDSDAFGFRRSDSVPSFFCPSCEVPLHYDGSRTSDTRNGLVEFSDYYTCPAGCGTFEYERHRHRLRLARPGYSSGGAAT